MTGLVNRVTSPTQASSPVADPGVAFSDSRLGRLPVELIVKIISILPSFRDIKSLGRVCHDLHNISETGMTSHALFANHLPCAYSEFGRLPTRVYPNLYNAFGAIGRNATGCAAVGDRLYAGFVDGTIKIFSVHSGHCLKTIKEQHRSAVKCLQEVQVTGRHGDITCVHFAGDYLFTGSKDGTVKVWLVPITDMNFDTHLNSYVMNQKKESDLFNDNDAIPNEAITIESEGVEELLETFNFIKLHLFPGGMLISEDSNKTTIKIWELKGGMDQDVKSPHCLQTFEGHQAEITCLEKYQGRLITGSQDRTVRICDLDTRECLITLDHDDPIASLLIIEDDDRLRTSTLLSNISYVWDLKTGELLARE